MDACLQGCYAVPDYACEGVLWLDKDAKCFRKTNINVDKCDKDRDFDLYVRDDWDDRPPLLPPTPPAIPPGPAAPPPPLWQKYEGHNCYWDGHGSYEIDQPNGSPVAGVNTIDACLAACIEVPDFICEGVIWNPGEKLCYRKANITLAECTRDFGGLELHKRTDTRYAHPPPPWSSRLSPNTCDALLADPNGMLKQMWNKWGWRQLHNEEPCWGWGGGDDFFDNVISGGSCNSNWYEGSIGWQNFREDAPGVLGFDDAVHVIVDLS